eukprot:CAMPEP_0172189108 /NCGR_PEP_ID=MMETSP1050-20130122/22333_1 /TAXON_ID=233186 /ORGANISM="Cryptomonas curvata, Strain CCAP979/52" /LENGTH=201 /DNA_ID=CAMNT_0012863751 /DNA_START=2356 /DNA_END=2957 /DNA_ORIENTATION=+
MWDHNHIAESAVACELQEQAEEHLQGPVAEQSAPAYLSPGYPAGGGGAGESGGGGVGRSPTDCTGGDKQLLWMAEEIGAGRAELGIGVVPAGVRRRPPRGRTAARCPASAREAGVRTDERRRTGRSGRGSGKEYALLLLHMALRCAHAHAAQQTEAGAESGAGVGIWRGGMFWEAGLDRRCARATVRWFGVSSPSLSPSLP